MCHFRSNMTYWKTFLSSKNQYDRYDSISYWALRYTKQCINGRWPEAEPYIMKYPEEAYIYARDVMRLRWKEAEKYIMKDSRIWGLYNRNVLEHLNGMRNFGKLNKGHFKIGK